MPERTSKKETKDREKSEQGEQRNKTGGGGADVISNCIITNCRLNCKKETEYMFSFWLQI